MLRQGSDSTFENRHILSLNRVSLADSNEILQRCKKNQHLTNNHEKFANLTKL